VFSSLGFGSPACPAAGLATTVWSHREDLEDMNLYLYKKGYPEALNRCDATDAIKKLNSIGAVKEFADTSVKMFSISYYKDSGSLLGK
jgi:hypothetical protein